MNGTKKIVICGLLIALSFIGANIKIFGTIAFDSLPAFLGTLVLGFYGGGVIGFLGHMLTALTSGFPFGIVVHLIIAAGMAITMGVFYFSNSFMEKCGVNWIIRGAVSSLAASIVNGPVILFVLTPILTWPVCAALFVPLFTVAMANSLLGYLIHQALIKAHILNRKGAVHES